MKTLISKSCVYIYDAFIYMYTFRYVRIFIYKRLKCKVSPQEFDRETRSSIAHYDMY